MRPRTDAQAGFSMIELMVALVVTLMIAGGIFTLLYDGSNTFGREPLLTDTQQNGRIAMSMIESDLISAGAGAGGLAQVFSTGLNNQAADSQGTATPQSSFPDTAGERPDSLEIRAAVDECATVQLCSLGPGTSSTGMTVFPACMQLPGLVQITDLQGHSVTLWACTPSGPGSQSNCPGSSGGANNGHVVFPPGLGVVPTGCQGPGIPCNSPPGNPYHGIGIPAWMTSINKVRYEVRLAADGVPSLWRSPTGGTAQGANGACAVPGGAAAANDWQLVARGIEDLQVRYRTGGAGVDPNDPTTWPDEPAAATCTFGGTGPGACTPTPAHWDEVTREVEVRLSARVVTPRRVQGETNEGGVQARRMRLYTRVSPRAALLALQGANQFR